MIIMDIINAARSIGLDAHLLIALCSVESDLRNVNNWNDRVAPALGVCQLHLDTAREINPTVDILALQNTDINAIIGGKYLKYQIKRYNSIWGGVAAYNMGSVRMTGIQYVNQDYVDKVKIKYKFYKKHICINKRKCVQ